MHSSSAVQRWGNQVAAGSAVACSCCAGVACGCITFVVYLLALYCWCCCCAQAFVDFESYEEASKAMREKDHKVFNEKFGDRYVRLIQVSAGGDT